MKCFIWTDEVSYTAFAHCENVTEARSLLRDEIGGYDGSCPEREKARKTMEEFTPSVYLGRIAGFRLSDSAEVRELEKYQEKLTAERDQLRAEVDRLRGESERHLAAYNTAEQERHDLVSKHELRCLQRDAATARAEAAEATLRDLATILNPHESFDASKLPGWARDTVARAEEADQAEKLVAGMRVALEDIRDNSRTCAGAQLKAHAALALTPASAGAKLKAEAWGEAAEKVAEWSEKLMGYERAAVLGCAANLTEIAERLTAEAEKEAANGR